MKRFGKYLAFLFVLSVILVAVIATTATAGAADIYYELYDREGDTTPFYRATSAEFSPVYNERQAGYVKLLKDVTQSQKILIKSDLVIDLNGYKYNHKSNKLEIGSYTSVASPYDFELTIKNGTYTSNSGQALQPRPGTCVTFENVTATYTSSGGQLFYGAQGRMVNFIDSTLTFTSSGVFILNSNAIYSTTYLDEEGMQINLINSFILNGYNGDVSKSGVLIKSVSDVTEGALDLIKVNLIGTSGINLRIFDPSCNLDSDRTVRASRGALFATDSDFPTKENGGYDVEFYEDIVFDAEKGYYVPVGEIEEPMFVDSDNETFPYLMCKMLCNVTWVYRDGDNVVSTLMEDLPDGKAPDFEAPKLECFTGNDGLVYYTQHIGWSSTEGSDTVEVPVLTQKENYFYAVYEDRLAAVVHYESRGGEYVNAYAEGKLDLDDMKSFDDGSYILVQADVDYIGSERIDNLNSITIDLNGNSFNLVGAEGTIRKICTPNNGKTVTIENGVLYSEGENAIFGAAGGTVVLNNVTLRSVGKAAIDMRQGKVVMNGGEIRVSDSMAAIVLGNGAGSVNVSLDGTKVYADNGQLTASAILLAGSEGTVTNANVSFDGVTVNAGYVLNCENDVDGATTLNFTGVDSDLSVQADVFNLPKQTLGFEPEVYYFNSVANVDPRAALGGVKLNTAPGYSVVSSDDGYITVNANTSMSVSLTVGEDFTLNLYIPVDTDVDVVTVNKTKIFTKSAANAPITVEIDGVEGEYYYVRYSGIKPNTAADDLDMKMNVTADGTPYVYTTTYSVLDYLETLITSGKCAEAEIELAKSILLYVDAAYDYFAITSKGSVDERERLDSLVDAYCVNGATIPKTTATDFSAVNQWISSVQYKLGETVSLRLNLTEAGKTETISVKVGTTEATLVYDVYGNRYADVVINAVDLAEEITITVGDATLTYSLAEYVNNVSDATNETLVSMLRAFYNYSVAASGYKTFLENSSDFVEGDTPVVDVDGAFAPIA